MTDPDPKLRSAAVRGLSNLGLPSEEALPIMLAALRDLDVEARKSAARWFFKTTPAPEKVVPLLISGLTDPAVKMANAAALRSYGSRASFAAGRLIELATTNDAAVSSVAKWALSGVDPEAAAAAGVQLE
jgi:HEAT repeat protein